MTFTWLSACWRETLDFSRPITHVFEVLRFSNHGFPTSICACIDIVTQMLGR
jgi:hypothetical protein